jgi:hypothetical protein
MPLAAPGVLRHSGLALSKVTSAHRAGPGPGAPEPDLETPGHRPAGPGAGPGPGSVTDTEAGSLSLRASRRCPRRAYVAGESSESLRASGWPGTQPLTRSAHCADGCGLIVTTAVELQVECRPGPRSLTRTQPQRRRHVQVQPDSDPCDDLPAQEAGRPADGAADRSTQGRSPCGNIGVSPEHLKQSEYE